ncbi:MAG TPA: right-handed parallel beta-helix repeat-containing protein [Acidimicrobiales bacterium]|nr:right-handed parallel beta-helix repeat-containing protein [Acidimicrobiales bacterium]
MPGQGDTGSIDLHKSGHTGAGGSKEEPNESFVTDTPDAGQPPCPAAPTDSSFCLGDWLLMEGQAHPTGFTWNATGESWEVDHGVHLRHPQNVTIIGGSFHDGETAPYRGPNGHILNQSGNAVFTVGAGNGVTFEGTTITGAHKRTWFDWKMAGGAAFYFEGTENLSVENVNVSNVFGDGLTFVPQLNSAAGVVSQPSGTVDNFTLDNAGRIGLDIASANHLVIKNVYLQRCAYGPVIFESESPNMHARNVTIDGLSTGGPIYFDSGGSAEGPILIENWTMRNSGSNAAITMFDTGAYPFGGQVTFLHDVLHCGWSLDRACVSLIGPSPVTVEDSTFYPAYPLHIKPEGLYSVTNHSQASFINNMVVPNPNGGGYRRGLVSWNSTVDQSGGNFPPPLVETSPPTKRNAR